MNFYIQLKDDLTTAIKYYQFVLNGTWGATDKHIIVRNNAGIYSYYSATGNIETDWTARAGLVYNERFSSEGYFVVKNYVESNSALPTSQPATPNFWLDNGILTFWNGTSNQIPEDKNVLGAIQFTDTQYVGVTPLTVPANTPTQLANNKGSVLNISAPSEAVDWCDVTGKLNSNQGDGDSFLTRVTFAVTQSANNQTFTVSLDIGSGGYIWEEKKQLLKSIGSETKINLTIPYYVLAIFFANGGALVLESQQSLEVRDCIYLIQRTYKV